MNQFKGFESRPIMFHYNKKILCKMIYFFKMENEIK